MGAYRWNLGALKIIVFCFIKIKYLSMVSAALKSWISYDNSTQFPLENIPFGIFTNPRTHKNVGCTRIGDTIIDLNELEHERLFTGPLFATTKDHYFCKDTLNSFAAAGKAYRIELRQTLQSIFGIDGSLPQAL